MSVSVKAVPAVAAAGVDSERVLTAAGLTLKLVEVPLIFPSVIVSVVVCAS